MRNLLYVLLLALTWSNASGQSPDFNAHLAQVDHWASKRHKHYYTKYRDSVFTKFESAVVQLLKHPEFCITSLDTTYRSYLSQPKVVDTPKHFLPYHFMNSIGSCTAPDQQLKLFSWDDLGGGSYHSYTNYIQYKVTDNRCMVQPIDTHHTAVEVGYYNIEQLQEGNRTYYFCLGYGTYGGGMHHKKLKVLELKQGLPVECFDCYPNQKPIVVYTTRGQDSKLNFNPTSKKLTYKQFVYNEETGFFKEEFKTVELIFKNGQFTSP